MDKVIDYFEREFELSKIEKTKLKYSIEVLFNDISKILILLVMFFILGKTREFIYSVIALLTLRPFTGGFHFKSYMGCLLFTGAFFASSITLNENINTNSFILILFVFSSITILMIAPIISKNRPSYSYKKQLYFKFIGLSIVTIHFVTYILINKNPYLRSSIWVFTLQSIELLIKKGVDIYERKKSHRQSIT